MGWKRKKGEFPEFNRNLIKTIFTRIEQTGHFAVVYSPDSHRMPINVDMSSSDPIDLRRLKKLEPRRLYLMFTAFIFQNFIAMLITALVTLSLQKIWHLMCY